MPLNICQLFYVLQFYVFLSKYMPSSITKAIIFRKQQCVEPRPEEMQVPVKRFLYSFYIHIKILLKAGVSLMCS